MTTRIRPVFAIALVAVVLAVIAGLTTVQLRHRADVRNLDAVLDAGRSVQRPAAADASTACHGDDVVSCWVSKETPRQLVTRFEPMLTRDGTRPEISCADENVPVPGKKFTKAQFCQVALRRGEHVAMVALHPEFSRKATLTGRTLIQVSAS